MDQLEAIKARHSVRAYNDKPLEPELIAELQALIDQINQETGLHIQLCLNEGEAFHSITSRIRHFHNVNNYMALVGKETPDLEEIIGYNGEKIVLWLQQKGLGSCWVSGSYSKGKCVSKVDEGEKRVSLISFGYADDMSGTRKTKSIEELSKVDGEMPDWFRHGMEAAQVAPTGFNKQKFLISLEGDKVKATAPHALGGMVDLGIVKYHFEIGAKDGNWTWVD